MRGGPPIVRNWGSIADFEQETGIKVVGQGEEPVSPVLSEYPGSGNTTIRVANTGKGFSVTLKDNDSGEVLPSATIYPTEDRAQAAAQEISRKSQTADAKSSESTKSVETAAEPSTLPGVSPDHFAYPYQQMGDAVVSRALAGESMDNVQLRTMAKEFFKGQPSQKDLYDAVELGVNRHVLAHPELYDVQKVAIGKVIKNLEDLVSKLPTQTHREAGANEFQQYSTPPFYSAVVSWAANVRPGDLVLEPSAGVGGLAVFPRLAGAEVLVNEFDRDRRAKLLEAMPGWKGMGVEDARFIHAHLHKAGMKPTVVIMNPPFSSTSGKVQGKRDSAQGVKHIDSAFTAMAPGGRLVAIMGDMEGRAWKEYQKRMQDNGLATVQAIVKVDGKTYRKYGTSFDSVVLVMDKVPPPAGHEIIQGKVETLEDLADILKGVRNGRSAEGTQQTGLAAEHVGHPVEPGGNQAPEDAGNLGVSGNDAPVTGGGRGPEPLESKGKAGDAGGVSAGQTGGGRNPRTVRGSHPAVHEPAGVGSEAGGKGGASSLQPGNAGAVHPDEHGSGSGEVQNPGGTAEHPGGAGSQDLRDEHVGDTETKITKGEPKPAEAEETPDAIFSTYRPSKVSFPGAKPHPGDLVESQAMAAVNLPDALPSTKIHIPEEVIKGGKLSDAQLEAIFYATQATNVVMDDGQRQGFLIGDGTGVGKGREISGTIMSALNAGQGGGKAVWLSKNSDLFKDATRDWTGIGGKPDELFDLSKIKATVGDKGAKTVAPIPIDKGVLFGTYATVTGVKGEVPGARKLQLENWLGKDFDGVIVLDEAHLASNLGMARGARGQAKPSQTALGMQEIQRMFPKARVVYVTATVASDPTQLAFLERLGLWGKGKAFARPAELLAAVQNAGLAGMELVARDLKARGLYIARNLSYQGVNYRTLQHSLNPDQTQAYDTAANAWQTVLENMAQVIDTMTNGQNSGKVRGQALSKFYGQQQAFFNSLLTSLTLPTAFEDMKKALDDGNSVVIQLTETGEARQGRAMNEASTRAKETGEDLDVASIDLSPKDILIGFLKSGFPVNAIEEVQDENGNVSWQPVRDAEGNPVEDPQAVATRDALIAELATMKLPGSALDEILKEFGTDNVAEITGRGERRVFLPDGSARIEKRTDKQVDADKESFMGDKKRILVFSKAANTGMSFHADNAAVNRTKRVHYVLQAGWNASDAIQGLGRTHRTNQAQAPEYVLVTTDLGGHKRFTSSIARRISQLGALTKGQRQASAGLFTEKDNLESPTALRALSTWYDHVMRSGVILPDGSTFTEAEFEKATGLHLRDHDGNPLQERPPMRQFLNRVLALPVQQQNAVFESLADRIDEQYHLDEQSGLLEKGLQNIPSVSAKVVEEDPFFKDPDTGAETVYQKIEAKQKINYRDFKKINQKATGWEGFFQDPKRGIPFAVTKTRVEMKPNGESVQHYKMEGPSQIVYRPNVNFEALEKLDPAGAREAWDNYKKEQGETETKPYHMITGAMLNIWNRFPENLPMDVGRIKLSDGNVAMGRIIPESRLTEVLGRIGADKAMSKAQKAVRDMKAPDLMKSVLQEGKTVTLANGYKLTPVRRSGEYFAVLEGVPHQTAMAALTRQYTGWRMEQFQGQYGSQYKVVIPDNAEAKASLDTFLKAAPVNTVSEPRAGWVRPRSGETGAIAADLVPTLLTAPVHLVKALAETESGKELLANAKGFQDAIKTVLAPATVNPQSQRAADILSKELGRLHLEDARARANLNRAWKAVNRLPREDQISLMDMAEGKTQGLSFGRNTEEAAAIQKALEFTRKLFDQDYADVVSTGKSLSYIESYLPHMYKDAGKARPILEAYAKRPMEGNQSWAKHRTIPYLSEAILEHGLEPASWNFLDMVMARHFDMQKFVAAHRAFNAYKKEGLVRYVRAARTAPEGYVKLDDRIAEVASIRKAIVDIPVENGEPVRTAGKLLPGAKVTYGHYWAPAPVASVFNNYLAPGFLGTPLAGAYKVARTGNNLLNMAQLGLSAFHGTFITIEGAAGAVSRGIMLMAQDGKLLEGMADIAKGAALPVAVTETFREGLAFRKALLSENPPEEFKPLIDMFIRGGGRVGMDRQYSVPFIKMFTEGWRESLTSFGGIPKGISTAPFALVELLSKPIMETYVPVMKLGTMAQLFHDEMACMPADATQAEIDRVARKVVDHVEDRMGQMTYDNLHWNQFTKQTMMLALRAVGWDVGSWRMILGAGADTLGMAPRAAQAIAASLSGPEAKQQWQEERTKRDRQAGNFGKSSWMTYNIAQTWAVMAVVSLMGGLTTWMLTGQPPKDAKDLIYPRTGRKDKYGKDERVQFASYAKEVIDLKHIAQEASPVHYEHGQFGLGLNLSPAFNYLWGKKSPFLGTVDKFLTNKDWKGQQVYTPNAGKKTLEEFGMAALAEFAPFSLAQAEEKWQTQGGAKSLLPTVGLTKPRQENLNTDAENKLVAMLADRQPRVIEKAKGDREQEIRIAKDAYVLGNQKPLKELQAEGQLTPKDFRNIVGAFKSQSLIQRLSNATNIQAQDLIKVWPDMTDEEKLAVWPAVTRKMGAAFKSAPPAEREALKASRDSIVQEVTALKAGRGK